MARALRGVLILLLIVLLVLVAGYIYLRGSLPQVRGSVELPGLINTVEVMRDQHAVPHIFAESKEDAYFALGFVHAQDRLWQMEFQRRVGAGRLAEVVGEAALGGDKFLRTLGVYRYAEATVPNLSDEARATMTAYVNGINTFLETRSGPLPPEFLIFGLEPEPWTLPDVLVWGKMMAYNLGGNWDSEVLRARLSTRLDTSQVAELWPPYPGDAPITLPDFRTLYGQLELDSLWTNATHPLPLGTGSNNWVVDGSKSATGLPLLANDPHLGLQTPSLWYFAHLSAPGLEVIGATLPGTPSVLLGRNDRIAWGFTNTGPDVQDTFIEQVNPDNSDEYLTPEGYKPFGTRTELFRVAGEADVTLEVRETRHGPVISDVSNASASAVSEGYVLALSWTALTDDDKTLQAALELNTAQTWDEFVAALENFDVPQQNMVYADTEGNIGYYAPGRVPIRRSGDGLVPVPGWTGEYDWTGFIPYEDLPHTFNPASSQIMTANHKIVPDDYPYFITSQWAEPYRAERINALLARSDAHTLESFAQIQADQLSLMARTFLPFLLEVEPQTELGRAVLADLLAWDGTMNRETAAPLVFYTWYDNLVQGTVEDELGQLFTDFENFRPLFVEDVLSGETATDWCDNVRTSGLEDCTLIISQAFENAVASLADTYGERPTTWRWGEAHAAYQAHPVLGETPLAPIFNLTLPRGGDAFTVNAARFDLGDEAPRNDHGPGFRGLYDLSNLDNSRYIHSTGQSGNPLSRHYRDFFERWRDVEYLPMMTDRAGLEDRAIGTLRLTPSSD